MPMGKSYRTTSHIWVAYTYTPRSTYELSAPPPPDPRRGRREPEPGIKFVRPKSPASPGLSRRWLVRTCPDDSAGGGAGWLGALTEALHPVPAAHGCAPLYASTRHLPRVRPTHLRRKVRPLFRSPAPTGLRPMVCEPDPNLGSQPATPAQRCVGSSIGVRSLAVT